jgi:BlaI family penicillinase repressor
MVEKAMPQADKRYLVTPAELEILNILWQIQPTTVSEVHQLLPDRAYTTVLKFFQIMIEKGYVSKSTEDRARICSSRVRQEQIQDALLSDLLERAFSNSSRCMIQRLLQMKKVTPHTLRILGEAKKPL